MHFQAPLLLAIATMGMAKNLVARQQSDINLDDLPYQCEDNEHCLDFLVNVDDCRPIQAPFSRDRTFKKCICHNSDAVHNLKKCYHCTGYYGDIGAIYKICQPKSY